MRMSPKLLLIPLVPAIAIGIGLVARELSVDQIVASPTIAPVANQAPPTPPPAPCGPNCGTDA